MADGMVSRLNQRLYAAADERRLQATLLMPSGAGAFSARSGRRPGSGLTVTTATVGSTEIARVSAGTGVIYDAAYDAQGPYVLEVPAQVQKNLTARPGAGLSRIDLVVARVADPDVGSGSERELLIEIIPGIPAASPSAPAQPSLSLLLATITVPATGSLSVEQSTARTVASGGVLPVATTTVRDALPSPYPGLAVYVEADDALFIRSTSGEWREYAQQRKAARLARRTIPATAAGLLPVSTGQLAYMPNQTIPGQPFGPGVDWELRAEAYVRAGIPSNAQLEIRMFRDSTTLLMDIWNGGGGSTQVVTPRTIGYVQRTASDTAGFTFRCTVLARTATITLDAVGTVELSAYPTSTL